MLWNNRLNNDGLTMINIIKNAKRSSLLLTFLSHFPADAFMWISSFHVREHTCAASLFSTAHTNPAHSYLPPGSAADSRRAGHIPISFCWSASGKLKGTITASEPSQIHTKTLIGCGGMDKKPNQQWRRWEDRCGCWKDKEEGNERKPAGIISWV